MQPLEECPPRQMPVLLNPFREPLAGGLELLTCGASQDAWHAVPLWHPAARESQKGEAPLRAWVKTAEPVQMRLLRRHLESALALLALPRREVGFWCSGPTVSGRSCLCGLRTSVTSFPVSWAFPTAEYYA